MTDRPSVGGPEHTHIHNFLSPSPQGKDSNLPLIELRFFSFPFFKLASDVYKISEDVFHI